MSTTQTLLRAASYGPDGLLSSSPAEQIQRSNGAVHSSLGAAERFVTVFAGQIDRDGRLEFADAGHGHALVRRVDGSFERLDATGLPLGVEPGATYTGAVRQLEPGDVLLVATDGLRDVLESVNVAPWTVQIANAVTDWPRPDSVVNDLVLWAQGATEGAGADDDLTVAAAVFYGEGGAGPLIDRPPESRTYEATVSPSLDALAPHGEAASVFLRYAGIVGGLADELVLGMHEVLANVVAHAAPAHEIGLLIEVRALQTAINVEIVTSDGGHEPVLPPRSTAPTDRGRGLELCRALFDSVDHVRQADTSLWMLNKLIPFALPATREPRPA